MSKQITFSRGGRRITGRVIAQDSDPRAALWVVDATNPDLDYLVDPSEVRYVSFDRRGRAVTMSVPT